MTGIFGIAIDSSDAEAALLAHLEEWMGTYIPEILRQRDPGKTRWPKGIEPIRAYSVKHAIDEKWPEDQLPMLLAQSPGMSEDPKAEGDGGVSATFGVALLAISTGYDEADAKALARIYSTAARLAVIQHPSLGGFAENTTMGQELNSPVTKGVEAQRNLMAVSTPYYIAVEEILDRTAGPAEPLAEPDVSPADLPRVKKGGGSATVEALRVGGVFPPK